MDPILREKIYHLMIQPSHQIFKIVICLVFTCGSQSDPGRVTIQKLNKLEYVNSLKDLLQVESVDATSLPEDNNVNGFKNISNVLTITPTAAEAYLSIAEDTIDRSIDRVLNCDPLDESCFYQFLSEFGTQAFRRPLINPEVQKIQEVFQFAKSQGLSNQEAAKSGMIWVLVSPSFLYRYRTHSDPNNPNQVEPLSNYELASKLSFFLWSSPPDDELLRLAKEGLLNDNQVLTQQVHRSQGKRYSSRASQNQCLQS